MKKWVSWFVKRGHDVYFITDSLAKIDGVKIYPIYGGKRNSILNFIKKIKQTRIIVKKIKPDILHAHNAFGYGTFGAFAKFHPLVISPWGSDILIEAQNSFLTRLVVKYALKKADLITCDGENTIEKMKEMGINPKKIHKIYHGIDPEQFSPSRKDYKLKDKLGIGNSPVILSTRNLDKIYDVETLVKSIPSITKKFPNAKILIAGELAHPEKMEFDYLDHLKDIAKNLNVIDNVKFVGVIPHDDLANYLTMADVYVSTSLSDGGIALSTLEAMSCESAMVVTDVANNSKWIKDGENGFLIPVKSPDKLAEKVNYLLEHKDVGRKFGETSRNLVKEKQNYEKEMEKAEKLCINLIR
jgi:glycosyltransferase involved in cell wall biosynthesis